MDVIIATFFYALQFIAWKGDETRVRSYWQPPGRRCAGGALLAAAKEAAMSGEAARRRRPPAEEAYRVVRHAVIEGPPESQ